VCAVAAAGVLAGACVRRWARQESSETADAVWILSALGGVPPRDWVTLFKDLVGHAHVQLWEEQRYHSLLHLRSPTMDVPALEAASRIETLRVALPRLVILSTAGLTGQHEEYAGYAEEEAPLLAELRERGASYAELDWEGVCQLEARGKVLDWRDTAVVVVRTTWTYSMSLERCRALVGLLARLEAKGMRVVNSADIVRRTVHKSYLLRLASRYGIRTVPSLLIRARPATAPVLSRNAALKGDEQVLWLKNGDAVCWADRVDVIAAGRARGWDACVLKPAVGGGSRLTRIFWTREDCDGAADVECHGLTVESGHSSPDAPFDMSSLGTLRPAPRILGRVHLARCTRDTRALELLTNEGVWYHDGVRPRPCDGNSNAHLAAPTLLVRDTALGGIAKDDPSPSGEDMVLQPVVPSVSTRGELSLIVVGFRVVHALRKVPTAGSFRTQHDFGAKEVPVEPTSIEIASAVAAAHALHKDAVSTELSSRSMEFLPRLGERARQLAHSPTVVPQDGVAFDDLAASSVGLPTEAEVGRGVARLDTAVPPPGLCSPLSFVRVDMLSPEPSDPDQRPMVIELEAIEPSLYYSVGPPGARPAVARELAEWLMTALG
jgi:hypothetical protein